MLPIIHRVIKKSKTKRNSQEKEIYAVTCAKYRKTMAQENCSGSLSEFNSTHSNNKSMICFHVFPIHKIYFPSMIEVLYPNQ